MRACTLLYIIGVYIGYNHVLNGEALPIAFYLLYLPFNIAVLLTLHYKQAIIFRKTKKMWYFSLFFAKKLLKSFVNKKKAVPLHRNQTIRGLIKQIESYIIHT